MNFLLPDSFTAAGTCEVRLARLDQEPPTAVLTVPANASVQVSFQGAPPRVSVLGIRYQSGNPPRSFEPGALDFLLIHSWLGRAYPVARVEWSQLVVDGPQAWPFEAPVINSYIRAIRLQDVQGGSDARTHYFGLVSDGNVGQFMRGLASGVPDQPDPSTVAAGPTGRTGNGFFSWDTDGSWGDWYTGHELAHTFGRYHAEFCGALDGKPYPNPNGLISDANGTFVGFDVGDPARQLPLVALPGIVWHDVMTYCHHQWLSYFTSKGILDRLVAEDNLPAGPAPAGNPSSATSNLGRSPPAGPGPSTAAAVGRGVVPGASAIHVVATVNLTNPAGRLHTRLGNGEARFRFLIQRRTDEEAMPLDRATVRWDEGVSQPIHVVTASADLGSNPDALLYSMIPDIDEIDGLLTQESSDNISMWFRGVSESKGDTTTSIPSPNVSYINLSPFESDEFGVPRAYVQIIQNGDFPLADAMDVATRNLILKLDPGANIFNYDRDAAGSTYHEAGTLWMGDDPATSVTDANGCFHHVSNAYCIDQSLFPTVGSVNPTLTGLVLTRKVAEAIIARPR